MNRSCPLTAVAWALAVLCATMATGASAKTASAPTPSDPVSDSLPVIQITGTSLRRLDAETALPVTVLRRADIERSGARTTTELLQQLPVMQGVVPTTTVVGNDSHGYASVSIHDLGDAYTLVLLNGQRVAPFAGQSTIGALPGVDINTIPLAMVDRIEILTDGASALYGADALGGVVNIITRRDVDVDEADVGVTWPRVGAREWRASVFKGLGKLDERGQALSLAGSIMQRSALLATERGYASQSRPVFSHAGQTYRLYDLTLASAPANALNAAFSAGGNAYFNANGACPSGQNEFYGLCLYNYAADLDLIPEQKQESFMASYTRLVGPDGKLQFDALWSRSTVTSHLAPVPATLQVSSSSPLYASYLTGMGVTDDPADVYYRFTDIGRRGYTDTSTLLDLALRLDGRLSGWAWQMGFKHSMSDLVSDVQRTMGRNAAQSLIDHNLLEPFASGPLDAATLAAVNSRIYNGRWLSGRSTLQEWSAQASRDEALLPGGPLKVALGVNLRRERMSFSPSLFAQGLLSDPAAGTLASPGSGDLRLGDGFALEPTTVSRWVWGGFAEMLAPLTPAFDLGAAARIDHDELAGLALTGKTSARWRFAQGALWRASLGTGFRAPTLNQQRSPAQSLGQTGVAYACTPELQAQATALGAVPCSGPQSYAVIGSGNARLEPEQSVQASMGLRIEPTPGNLLGVDLWAVHIHDRIGSISQPDVFANPAVHPERWRVVQAGGGPKLAYVEYPVNLTTLMSSGVDVEGAIRRVTSIGLWDSQLRVSTILREDTQAFPGAPLESAIGDAVNGDPTIKWRASWRNSLTRSGWTHSLTMRYQSGYDDWPAQAEVLDANGTPTGEVQEVRLKVPGQILWDWQSAWQVNGSLQLTAGIVNLFNTKPPLSLNQSQTTGLKGQMIGYDERYFDARGRMLTLEARLAF